MCRGVVRRRPFIPPGGGLCRDVVRRRCVFWGRCIFYRGALRRSCFLHEMLMHPSRHLISRLRRQLLLEAKPYLVRIALQCFHNLPQGDFTLRSRISPAKGRFHPAKWDFTLPQEGLPHPSASPPASPRGEAILRCFAALFFYSEWTVSV